jgi:hypothetical protein
MKYKQMLNTVGHQLLKGQPMSESQFDYFYEYYSNNGEMPYGVAKARTGDPYDWVDAKVTEDYEQLCAVLQVSVLIN